MGFVQKVGTVGMIQAEAITRRSFAPIYRPPDYTESGDKEQPLFTFREGSYVTKAMVKVMGVAFQGKLRYYKGVKVMPSPVVYGTDGSSKMPQASGAQAFIIDFTGICFILKLNILNNKGVITLVLPWLGTEFSPKAVYPVPSPVADGQFLPKADPVGKAAVGLTGLETAKLLVQIKTRRNLLSEEEFLENCRITTATYPSNIRASINGRLPFWSYPGVLNTTVELAGLIEDLNALLKDAKEDIEVKLRLTTDTPGVLIVNFNPTRDLDVYQSANALWGGQAKLDVAFQALEPQSVNISFPTTRDKPWKVSRLVLNLAGQFPAWQAYSGQSSNAPGKLSMRINTKFSVARRFVFDEVGKLYGFSILLRSTADRVEIRLEVVKERDEQPDTGKPLSTADLSLPAEISTPLRWIDVLFPSPVKIDPNVGMWLVVKVKAGSVEWVGIAEPLSGTPATLFSSEGGLWQRYPLVEGKYPIAQISILRQPFVRENESLLDISWKRLKRSVDVTKDVVSVELNLPKSKTLKISPANGTVSVSLSMIARASGILTIKGATAFYKEENPDDA